MPAGPWGGRPGVRGDGPLAQSRPVSAQLPVAVAPRPSGVGRIWPALCPISKPPMPARPFAALGGVLPNDDRTQGDSKPDNDRRAAASRNKHGALREA